MVQRLGTEFSVVSVETLSSVSLHSRSDTSISYVVNQEGTIWDDMLLQFSGSKRTALFSMFTLGFWVNHPNRFMLLPMYPSAVVAMTW
jgi:hypothetical protein